MLTIAEQHELAVRHIYWTLVPLNNLPASHWKTVYEKNPENISLPLSCPWDESKTAWMIPCWQKAPLATKHCNTPCLRVKTADILDPAILSRIEYKTPHPFRPFHPVATYGNWLRQQQLPGKQCLHRSGRSSRLHKPIRSKMQRWPHVSISGFKRVEPWANGCVKCRTTPLILGTGCYVTTLHHARTLQRMVMKVSCISRNQVKSDLGSWHVANNFATNPTLHAQAQPSEMFQVFWDCSSDLFSLIFLS